jgi:hypothetical protein
MDTFMSAVRQSLDGGGDEVGGICRDSSDTGDSGGDGAFWNKFNAYCRLQFAEEEEEKGGGGEEDEKEEEEAGDRVAGCGGDRAHSVAQHAGNCN